MVRALRDRLPHWERVIWTGRPTASTLSPFSLSSFSLLPLLFLPSPSPLSPFSLSSSPFSSPLSPFSLSSSPFSLSSFSLLPLLFLPSPSPLSPFSLSSFSLLPLLFSLLPLLFLPSPSPLSPPVSRSSTLSRSSPSSFLSLLFFSSHQVLNHCTAYDNGSTQRLAVFLTKVHVFA